MARNTTFNILMYSHDTYGLGHIRRTMAIASQLRGPKINILILTGSPIAGRFAFPEHIDFVRIPGMIKKTNDEYLPLSIKINPKHALDIRKNIITATAKTFQPHLFIVDKEPLGLKKEVLPTLRWLKRCRPGTRTILGLRDIMDDAETIRHDWNSKGVYEVLEHLYSEIWIYGNREFYDSIGEYAISEPISRKMHFTGYIPRKVPNKNVVQNTRKEQGLEKHDKLVVVTTGGGGDGYPVMDNFLSMLESQSHPPSFKSILITGPFMPKNERKRIFKRARKLGVRTFHFYRNMEKIFAAADLVVCMGGYNTLCETLSQGTISLIIPRVTPRKEQLIRAKAFHNQHLVDYIPWNKLTASIMREKVLTLLDSPGSFNEAISGFKLTGIETMSQRLQAFRCGDV
ncbi:MAG: glycosyltransferase [Deltaproteobacteria bacterium]|nr:MAG: glycosyltransferase [Deltaproteobacteria bacterium]